MYTNLSCVHTGQITLSSGCEHTDKQITNFSNSACTSMLEIITSLTILFNISVQMLLYFSQNERIFIRPQLTYNLAVNQEFPYMYMYINYLQPIISELISHRRINIFHETLHF